MKITVFGKVYKIKEDTASIIFASLNDTISVITGVVIGKSLSTNKVGKVIIGGLTGKAVGYVTTKILLIILEGTSVIDVDDPENDNIYEVTKLL